MDLIIHSFSAPYSIQMVERKVMSCFPCLSKVFVLSVYIKLVHVLNVCLPKAAVCVGVFVCYVLIVLSIRRKINVDLANNINIPPRGRYNENKKRSHVYFDLCMYTRLF